LSKPGFIYGLKSQAPGNPGCCFFVQRSRFSAYRYERYCFSVNTELRLYAARTEERKDKQELCGLWQHGVCDELDIPSLSQHGLSQQMLPAIGAQARKASSMQNIRIELREPELVSI
jgi:hypothetical protein